MFILDKRKSSFYSCNWANTNQLRNSSVVWCNKYITLLWHCVCMCYFPVYAIAWDDSILMRSRHNGLKLLICRVFGYNDVSTYCFFDWYNRYNFKNIIFLNDIIWKKGCNLETEHVDLYWYHLNYKLKSNEYLKDISFHGLTGVKWPLPLVYDQWMHENLFVKLMWFLFISRLDTLDFKSFVEVNKKKFNVNQKSDKIPIYYYLKTEETLAII